MKKFMILATAVLISLASQAAVVMWGTSSAVTFNGTKLGGLSVDLYIVGVGGEANLLFDTRSTQSTPVVNKGKLPSNASAMQDTYDYTSTVAGGALWNEESKDLGRQYYMVIKYNDGTDDYTYTSDAVASSGLDKTANGSVTFTFSDTIGAEGAKNAWVKAGATPPPGPGDIPEPTSGLLLMVGGALLALRRKQK